MPNKHLYRILFTILMVVSFHAMATFTNAGVSAAGTGYEIKLDLNVRIPMRDGAILSADIYRPDTAGKFPVILLRTPYSNNSKRILDNGLYFAEHGFVFIAQDSRGRHDSEGRFRPFVDEGVFVFWSWSNARSFHDPKRKSHRPAAGNRSLAGIGAHPRRDG